MPIEHHDRPIIEASAEEWTMFNRCVSMILDLHLNVDLTAKAIAQVLFIIIDIEQERIASTRPVSL